MWLQLIFSFYVIFIAALLIITSWYFIRTHSTQSPTSSWYTAPIVSRYYVPQLYIFLFHNHYSLLSKTTTLVRSVDPNVTEIYCAICSYKSLFQAQFVNHFKRLLNVYQASYKQCYYWVSLHLLVKALFNALSALEKCTNFTIGVKLLHDTACGSVYMHPFKHWSQSCNEMMMLFNLSFIIPNILSDY